MSVYRWLSHPPPTHTEREGGRERERERDVVVAVVARLAILRAVGKCALRLPSFGPSPATTFRPRPSLRGPAVQAAGPGPMHAPPPPSPGLRPGTRSVSQEVFDFAQYSAFVRYRWCELVLRSGFLDRKCFMTRGRARMPPPQDPFPRRRRTVSDRGRAGGRHCPYRGAGRAEGACPSAPALRPRARPAHAPASAPVVRAHATGGGRCGAVGGAVR